MARAKKEPALTPEERLQAALVPDWEWPYKLPENWCWTRIGNYVDYVTDYVANGSFASLKANVSIFKDENYALMVKTQDFANGFTKSLTYTDKHGYDFLSKSTLHGGELILSNIGSVGKVFRVPYFDRPMTLASNSVMVKCYNSRDYDWMYYFLLSPIGFEELKSITTGTAVPKFNKTDLKTIPLPVPPLAEQQRIVGRIESLFVKLDEAKEKAQAVVDSFETRKAAILHKAFTGELTAKWREEHNISKTTWGEKKWGDFLQSIEAGKNWSAEGRPPEGTEFGVVKVSAVTWGEFDELESKTCVVAEQWNSKTQIHKGDFLFSRANTLQLVGNCVIVRNISKRLMLSDKILRFKFDEIAHPRFVLYFTRSRIYREQVEQLASGNQDGMRNISQKNLKLVFFPIPTVVEQIEIISILDRAFAKEQQAKEAAEAVLDEIDLMKKSILARAFRGELGTNDPNEESAVELLKEIIRRG